MPSNRGIIWILGTFLLTASTACDSNCNSFGPASLFASTTLPQKTTVTSSVTSTPAASTILNVLNFNAKGDGITDDGPAFTAARNACYVSYNYSCQIEIPAFLSNGVRTRYIISTPINFTNLSFAVVHFDSSVRLAGGLICNTGSRPCIDATGANSSRFENMRRSKPSFKK